MLMNIQGNQIVLQDIKPCIKGRIFLFDLCKKGQLKINKKSGTYNIK